MSGRRRSGRSSRLEMVLGLAALAALATGILLVMAGEWVGVATLAIALSFLAVCWLLARCWVER